METKEKLLDRFLTLTAKNDGSYTNSNMKEKLWMEILIDLRDVLNNIFKHISR